MYGTYQKLKVDLSLSYLEDWTCSPNQLNRCQSKSGVPLHNGGIAPRRIWKYLWEGKVQINMHNSLIVFICFNVFKLSIFTDCLYISVWKDLIMSVTCVCWIFKNKDFAFYKQNPVCNLCLFSILNLFIFSCIVLVLWDFFIDLSNFRWWCSDFFVSLSNFSWLEYVVIILAD